MSTDEEEYKHRSFRRLYSRVIREMRRIGITDADRYETLREIPGYHKDREQLARIEFGYARNVLRLYKSVERDVNGTNGISFVIDDMVRALNPSQVAKALTFSATTYMLTSMVADEVVTEHNRFYFSAGPDIQNVLAVVYNHLPDVLAGRITPMPDSVMLYDLDKARENDDAMMMEELKRVKDVARSAKQMMYANPLLGAEQWTAAPQMLKVSLSHEEFGQEYLRLGIVLPSLAGIPLETVRRIREDYHPEFVRFQNALMQFSAELNDISEQRRLFQLMQRTEMEVQALRSTLETVRRRHVHLAGFLALGVGLIFCFRLIPPSHDWVKTLLSTVLSGVGISAFSLFNPGSPKVENSPYYFPFRMVNEAQRIGLVPK